jgi:hypothetical protein
MVVVENKPGRFFTVVNEAGVPDAATMPEPAEAPSIEDLFSDPEVCRRVGNIIAKGARKPPAKKPDSAN